jgi:hypothetical protein
VVILPSAFPDAALAADIAGVMASEAHKQAAHKTLDIIGPPSTPGLDSCTEFFPRKEWNPFCILQELQ